jgi:hypothetical protein
MKTRFMRQATVVTGIATGALLFAGTAAQAATGTVPELGEGTAVIEQLPALPAPAGVPGLDALDGLDSLPVDSLPGGLPLDGVSPGSVPGPDSLTGSLPVALPL